MRGCGRNKPDANQAFAVGPERAFGVRESCCSLTVCHCCIDKCSGGVRSSLRKPPLVRQSRGWPDRWGHKEPKPERRRHWGGACTRALQLHTRGRCLSAATVARPLRRQLRAPSGGGRGTPRPGADIHSAANEASSATRRRGCVAQGSRRPRVQPPSVRPPSALPAEVVGVQRARTGPSSTHTTGRLRTLGCIWFVLSTPSEVGVSIRQHQRAERRAAPKPARAPSGGRLPYSADWGPT
jgi:hypothetical protein